MRKASFRGILLGMVGITVMSGAPVLAVSERHPGIPLTPDGRPKVMVESIDLIHNSMTFEYVDDGGMPVDPAVVEVAWFNEERYVKDTSELETIVDLWRTTELVLAENVSSGERVEIGGGVVRYTFRDLPRNLGLYDPTGKLTYLLKFEMGETEVFWNGEVDYTECLMEYRSGMNDVSKGICRGNYDGNGVVRYSLGGEEVVEEPVVEPGEPESSDLEPEGPSGSEESGELVAMPKGSEADFGSGYDEISDGSGSGEVDWDDAARSLGVSLVSYTGNEIEILRRERGDVEGAGVANMTSEDGFSEEKVEEGLVAEEDENQEGEVEVPELNGDEENDGRLQWWMVAVMGVLAIGIGAWWILPIFKRRKDEEGKQ